MELASVCRRAQKRLKLPQFCWDRGAGRMVRIHFPPGERCYGAGGEEMAPSIAARKQLMEYPMPQPNDLSRSLVAWTKIARSLPSSR